MSIKSSLLFCLCALLFPPFSFGGENQACSVENRSDSEAELFSKINFLFASISAAGKNGLPKRPPKICLRPLFQGSNLNEVGLPIFDSLAAIEDRAVHIFSKTNEIVLSTSLDDGSAALNLNCSIHQLRGDRVVFWELEFMREFPLGSSPSGVALEVPIWKDCRIQLFKADTPLNEGRWVAFDDLLISFCKTMQGFR